MVDHDALARAGDADRAVAAVPADGGEAVYRGWMLSSDRYAAFAEALHRRGVRLRTAAAQFRRAHELPGWYAALAALTPASVWTVGTARTEFTGAEVRTWWVDGACHLVGPHPDTPDQFPPESLDLTGLAPLVAGLGLSFVTVDLAMRSDGVWRVIELGDGQVSDRPATTAPEELMTALRA